MLLWGKEETTSLRSLEYMLPLLRGVKGCVRIHPLHTSKTNINEYHTPPPLSRGETTHINKRSKENTHINERSNVEPSLEDRPLVEEREEFFALSREEEKAV
jgi:hypothetical protein